jgi:tetratricopeptide (TPR) repeat protein
MLDCGFPTRPRLALPIADSEAPDQFGIALESLLTEDLDRGFNLLSEACARYPNDARGANLLGFYYYCGDRYDEACTEFSRAAGLAGGVSVYECNLGSALLKANRPREAAAAYHRSLNGDALLHEAHYWAWGALSHCGTHREALARLREALDQDPAQKDFEPLPERVDLSDVTLCVADCAVPDLAARSLRNSMAQCQFAAAKLFTSHARRYDAIETIRIDRISNIEDYSRFIMKSLGSYIDTQYALVTQWDSYVVNAGAWSADFLNYDYIGARWADTTVKGMGSPPQHNVGNGGFSLRSDTFLGAGADPQLVQTHPEDTHLCGTYRSYLEQGYGVRFADAALADRFSFEIILPDKRPFGFHGAFNVCCFESDPRWMRFEFLGPNAFRV